MSSIFDLSLSLLIPFSTGYAFLLWLDHKYAIPLSLKIALAYGLGLGLLAIWMLCLGMLQQNFNLFSIGMPLIIVTSILMIYNLKRKRHIKITKALVSSRSYLTNAPDNPEHTKIPPRPRVKSSPQDVYEITSKKSASQHGFMKFLKVAFIALLVVFIIQNIIYVFWRSMAIPISTWDAIATIAFKAKIFFFEQSLPPLDLLPKRAQVLSVKCARNL